MTDTAGPGADPVGGPLWRRIRDTLEGEIAMGRYAPGARFPTEHALATRFGVNRHTVRRALQALREAGRIDVRRGAGAVVTDLRIDYPLTDRPRFSASVEALGHSPGRRMIRLEEIAASAEEAELLRIHPGDPVVVMEGVGSIDDVPINHGRNLFPAGRLPGIEAALAGGRGITRALAAIGVDDYARAWTRLLAERADPLSARLLRMAEGDPVLHSRFLDCDLAGVPVNLGDTRFCSTRIALVVESGRFTSQRHAAPPGPAGAADEGETE
ncbi:MAG: phosphonate metabolism transcriptional regulator PhnF [Pseudomonadota bacterium]